MICPTYLVSGFSGFADYFVSLNSEFPTVVSKITWHISLPMGAALVWFIISCVAMNTAAHYIACSLFATGAYGVNSVILG